MSPPVVPRRRRVWNEPRRRWRLRTKVLIGGLTLAVLAGLGYLWCIHMPGTSFRGPLPPFTARETEVAAALRADLQVLAVDIGERNVGRPAALARAQAWIAERMTAAGLTPRRETYEVRRVACSNVIADVPGASAGPVVVIGAHYDTVPGCPGANDNGSGVVALLALARVFAAAGRERPARTLRLVAFVNEEPPWFQTPQMGSFVHARGCKERGEDVTAMLSLETMGCFSDAPKSQSFPPGVGAAFPSTGNFIAFVSDVSSRALLTRVVERFRAAVSFPSEGAALPGFIEGVSWSDHWSFSKHGYPGVMVTDTAPFRFRQYHTPQDTLETVDCARLARIIVGLEAAIDDLLR